MFASLIGPNVVFAATTPSLGAAATYGILGSTYTNTSAGTAVNGDVGFTTGPAVAPLGVHINYGPVTPYAAAGLDQANAATALAGQPCTFTFAPGAIDLSTDTTHGPVTVYTPGVYCSAGAMSIGGPLTLNGNGTFIFRPDGALTSVAGAVVSLNNASACDVFWTPTQAATLGANTTFVGNLISNAGITIGANTTWTGRSLAFGGTVTTDTTTITVPVCSLPPPTPTPAPAPVVVATSSGTVIVAPTTAPPVVSPVVSSPTPVFTPAPSTSVIVVPLASLPPTGLSFGDDALWYVINLIIPSLVFATFGSLYLFRKRV
jgi:hypothetical protein